MRGGSLTRYHTPVLPQGGSGIAEELVQLAGPVVLKMGQNLVKGVEDGQTVGQAAQQATRGWKRKAASSALSYGKRKAYKSTIGRVKDIFS